MFFPTLSSTYQGGANSDILKLKTFSLTNDLGVILLFFFFFVGNNGEQGEGDRVLFCC